ncbi:MAG: hypothetical protein KBS69_01260 [Bacteroidales bacterium]|nr:hypothetical protein [Candidatus Colicola caccequi]
MKKHKEGLERLKRIKETNNQIMKGLSLLSPRILKPGIDKAYEAVKELKYAFSQPDCYNIAVTGALGAGKSSVIKTFISESRLNNRKILSISLSNFCDKEQQRISLQKHAEKPSIVSDELAEGGEKFKGKENYIDLDSKDISTIAYENKIEYKIFQHILFKANLNKTIKSHHQRISYLSPKYSIGLIVLLVLWVIACLWIIQPSWIHVPNAIRNVYVYDSPAWLQRMAYLSFGIVTLAGFIIIMRAIYCRINHWALVKFKLDDIELNMKNIDSVFGELLNEILYFLKAGEYKVVVFEDLDRINNPQALFLKLREINILLNESDYYKKHKKTIKFVYAIKDELFTGEIRTKCFDFIVSVLPVVDKYNMGDFLTQKYANILNGIDKSDLLRLGMYVQGKREMTNIVNEYLLQKPLLMKDAMSSDKLLAMVIYKNLFPQDYANAYQKEGFLAGIFLHKDLFSMPLNEKDQSELTIITNSIDELTNNIRKLRQKFTRWLQQKGVEQLIMDDKIYDLEMLVTEDSLFELLQKDKIDQCVIIEDETKRTIEYPYTYTQMLTDLDIDGTSTDDFINWLSNLQKQTQRARELSLRITSVTKRPLYGILSEMKPETRKKIMQDVMSLVYGDVDERNEKEEDNMIDVLLAFINAQYVAEDYASYMSYSYEGALKEGDALFINSIMQDKALPVEYTLTNIAAIIDRLTSDNFQKDSILNFDLLNYLLKSDKEEHIAFLQLMIKTARGNLHFIMEYAITYPNNYNFYNQLFNEWNNCITEIMTLGDDERKVMLLLYFKIAPTNVRLVSREKNIIEQLYDLLNQNADKLNTKEFTNYIRHYRFHFTNLQAATEKSEWLYDFVIANDNYTLNQENLLVICGEEFLTQSYTSILKLEEHVQQFVSKDMNLLLSLFPESNTQDSDEAIIALINNQEVKDDNLKKYLCRQTTRIDYDEEKVPNYITRAKVLFESDSINPKWKNMECLGDELTDKKDYIVPFVKLHIDALKEQPSCVIELPLQRLLMLDNETLTTEEFKKIIHCCHYYFEEKDIKELNKDRIGIIIESNYIKYSLSGIDFVSSCEADMFSAYLIGWFDRFIMDNQFPKDKISNAIGLRILKSTLTADNKEAFLQKYLHIQDDEDAPIYAELVCKHYAAIGNVKEAKIDELIKALHLFKTENSWEDKITVVNKVNEAFTYNPILEEQMLTALGGGYLALNHYKQYPKDFYKNDQNIELFTYLNGKHKYISKVKIEDNNIKVTFKYR